ncbi:hypothetical protein BH10ACT8_BH10ACT8_22380 [soil metagenome]
MIARLLTLALVCLSFQLGVAVTSTAAGPGTCGGQDDGGIWGFTAPGRINVRGSCGGSSDNGGGASAEVTINCTAGSSAPDGVVVWDARCGIAPTACVVNAGHSTDLSPFAIGQRVGDRFLFLALWCPGQPIPQPSIGSLRDQATKLLPVLAVGVSPSKGTTLVNFRTLFWVETSTTRDLGTARLIGQQVAFRATFVRVDYDFGDGTSDSSAAPGEPYDPAADCGGCTDRFGHDYTRRGSVTATGTVSWHAQFKVGTGGWQDVPGTITGPKAATRLVVKESRSVLIAPTPGPS